jgi:hypothetical protein
MSGYLMVESTMCRVFDRSLRHVLTHLQDVEGRCRRRLRGDRVRGYQARTGNPAQ